MIITKETRLVCFPCNENAKAQKVKILVDGVLTLCLTVKLDFAAPKYTMHYDLFPFEGKEVAILCEEQKTFSFVGEKSVPTEKLRPKFHFAASEGWLNDPNGLVFFEGKYHMFFQHNPAGVSWGNMHWGHAVSEDLVRWEEQNIALYPDALGAMYSGSAIVDENNLLKKNTEKHKALLLFYTAAGSEHVLGGEPKPFTQCLAYSTDGAKSFQKYEGNPIVENRKEGNRDPKVRFVKELDCYVTALYAGAGEFLFLRSDDLVHWSKMNSFYLQGERECPDFYPLSDGKETKWVFTGANDYYAIGRLDPQKGFCDISATGKLGFGRAYASQTFAGLRDRVLRVSWNRFCDLPTENFGCEMSAFCELWLEDGKLCIKPADEIKKAYKKTLAVEGAAASLGRIDLEKAPLDMTLSLRVLCEEKPFTVEFFGNKITADAKEKTLSVVEYGGNAETMPLEMQNGKVDLRILSDNIGTEIFQKHAFGAFATVNRYEENVLLLSGGAKIERAEIHYL